MSTQTATDLEARLVALEERLQRVDDIEEIKQLQYEYGFSFDEDRLDDFANCFTEDCHGEYVPFTTSFDGRDEIRGILADLKEGYPRLTMALHYTVDPVIEVDGDTATGRWNWMVPCTVLRDDDSETAAIQMGRYDVRYRRDPDGWRIHRITCTYFLASEYHKGWVRQPMFTMRPRA